GRRELRVLPHPPRGHVGWSAVWHAERRIRDPQRARGHGEPHGRRSASRLVRERRRSGHAYPHDGGPLLRLARAHVVRPRAARDRRRYGARARHRRHLWRRRLRRRAAHARDRHSLGARCRAQAARANVLAAGAGSELRRRGRGPGRSRRAGTVDVVAVVRRQLARPGRLRRGARCDDRGGDARGLSAGAACGEDRSHEHAESGVARPSEVPEPTMHDWQSEVRARLAALRLKPERETEIVDEIAQHLAERYREATQAGALPDEATRLALAEFRAGNALAQRIAALRQAHAPAAVTLGASTSNLLADLWHDLRYAARTFAKQPGFAATAVLILALGIGATTAIFSVVYSVLIKPLPYPNADELVRIRHPAPGVNVEDIQSSSNMYLTYRQEGRTFANVGLWQATDATLTIGSEPQPVRALFVTDGTLQALGVQPARGRWFTAADHGVAPEGHAPLILSHSFWQGRFGGDEAALGRELKTDAPSGTGTMAWGSLSHVVGIMPRDFSFLDVTPQPDVIIPVRLDPDRQAHGAYRWEMLARLAPGVTLSEAQADLERMRPIHREAWPPFPGSTLEGFDRMRISAAVRPLQEDLVGNVASMLWVLMGAIGAVLLIACANIANLMLVRADARRQELAVRAALGARPGRIAKALLAESFVLGAAGSVLGLALAYAGLQVLVANGPPNLPRLQEISVQPPVLVFTVLV